MLDRVDADEGSEGVSMSHPDTIDDNEKTRLVTRGLVEEGRHRLHSVLLVP